MSRLVIMHVHSYDEFTTEQGERIPAGVQMWAFDPDHLPEEGPMPFKLNGSQQRAAGYPRPFDVLEVEYEQVVYRGRPSLQLVRGRRVGRWVPAAGIEDGTLAVAK